MTRLVEVRIPALILSPRSRVQIAHIKSDRISEIPRKTKGFVKRVTCVRLKVRKNRTGWIEKKIGW